VSNKVHHDNFVNVIMQTSKGLLKTSMDVTGFEPDGDPQYLADEQSRDMYYVQPWVNGKDDSDIVYIEVPEITVMAHHHKLSSLNHPS